MGEPAEPSGLLASARRLGRTLLAIASNRAALLLVEWQEERVRWLECATLLAALVVLATMTLLTFNTLIVIYCLRHGRYWPLIVVGLGYFVGALVVYGRLRARCQPGTAFSASLAEFKKDKACLEEKIKSD